MKSKNNQTVSALRRYTQDVKGFLFPFLIYKNLVKLQIKAATAIQKA